MTHQTEREAVATGTICSETSKDDVVEPPRILSPQARRALAEAEARRQARDAVPAARPGEIGGRTGPDPVRYGDWEQGGIAWDF